MAVFRWFSLVAGLCLSFSVSSQMLHDGEDSGLLVVMTSGAFAAALAVLAPQFERESGIPLTIVRGASSGGESTSILSRLASDEHADVIILSRASLVWLTDRGDVRPETRVDLVRSRIGIAVRTGVAAFDISSTDAFVKTIRDSESFGYSASVSGSYILDVLLPELGIWEQVQSKGLRVTDEPVGVAVARGEIEIGFQKISEILAVDGVLLVGPLPAELQLESTFSAAMTQRSANLSNARALIDFLWPDEVAEQIERTGLDPVAREIGR
ncbi:MAG: substrate-binding domain-containing protein [Candidatus Rariloculaceae bacterium]